MYTRLSQHKVGYFFTQNFKKFLQESTLHGLRFIGDDSISLLERLFFLCAFVVALISTGNLMDYIYTKWSLTPVIIATNPYPTSIDEIPFPAITLCNMNQLSRTKVTKYSENSSQSAIMHMACFDEVNGDEKTMPPHFRNNNISITEFLIEHSQPCSDMLLSCKFNSIQYNCSDIFREIITDEGVCCVFNFVEPVFRYKGAYKIIRNYTNTVGAIPVEWSPEIGYPKRLPDEFYPRPSEGIGVSMGLTLILNAHVDDYYCSSTNGPGFKLDLHNPIETPRIRENALTVSTGEDTRFRLTARSSSAMPSTRGFGRSVRRCIFNDESKLVYYKYYTRKNCENECQAFFIYGACRCIPYNLPTISRNASVCGASKSFCMDKAQKTWLRSNNSTCRANCLSSCFDLTYSARAFTAPLIQDDYIIQNAKNLRNFSREYIRDNIAMVSIFYREYVFYGDVRNVFVGPNEFLSNIGGILGLFLGFSFISLIEVFYYAIMRPISSWIRPQNENQSKKVVPAVGTLEENSTTAIWYTQDLYRTKQNNMQNGWLTYRRYKKDRLQEQLDVLTQWENFKKLQDLNE